MGYNGPFPQKVPEGGTGSSSLTNHSVLVGAGTSNITQLGVGTNGQVVIGATGSDSAFATLTSSAGSITLTPGVNSLNLDMVSFASGSYTPTFVGQTIAGTTTYVTQVGNYIQLANMIYVYGEMQISGATGTGNMRLSLPFNSNANDSFVGKINLISNTFSWAPGNGTLVLRMGGNQNTGILQTYASNTGFTPQMANIAIHFTYSIIYYI